MGEARAESAGIMQGLTAIQIDARPYVGSRSFAGSHPPQQQHHPNNDSRAQRVLAGPDPRSPIAIAEDGGRFARPLGRDFKGTRVAWSRGLDLPFEPAVKEAVNRQRAVFESLGYIVEDAEPDLAGADEAFKAWRAWAFELRLAKDLERHREQMKDTVIWNIEQGARLTEPQLGRAEVLRTSADQRVREFMEKYEFLVLPVSQVLPFPVGQE